MSIRAYNGIVTVLRPDGITESVHISMDRFPGHWQGHMSSPDGPAGLNRLYEFGTLPIMFANGDTREITFIDRRKIFNPATAVNSIEFVMAGDLSRDLGYSYD